ncbi:hypothetical protein BC828DRAFT_373682 [Blastocladiella britannica]|nr:hypothetical protein BC828DRAFT_373682 [Blastocladiella britannica]
MDHDLCAACHYPTARRLRSLRSHHRHGTDPILQEVEEDEDNDRPIAQCTRRATLLRAQEEGVCVCTVSSGAGDDYYGGGDADLDENAAAVLPGTRWSAIAFAFAVAVVLSGMVGLFLGRIADNTTSLDISPASAIMATAPPPHLKRVPSCACDLRSSSCLDLVRRRLVEREPSSPVAPSVDRHLLPPICACDARIFSCIYPALVLSKSPLPPPPLIASAQESALGADALAAVEQELANNPPSDLLPTVPLTTDLELSVPSQEEEEEVHPIPQPPPPSHGDEHAEQQQPQQHPENEEHQPLPPADVDVVHGSDEPSCNHSPNPTGNPADTDSTAASAPPAPPASAENKMHVTTSALYAIVSAIVVVVMGSTLLVEWLDLNKGTQQQSPLDLVVKDVVEQQVEFVAVVNSTTITTTTNGYCTSEDDDKVLAADVPTATTTPAVVIEEQEKVQSESVVAAEMIVTTQHRRSLKPKDSMDLLLDGPAELQEPVSFHHNHHVNHHQHQPMPAMRVVPYFDPAPLVLPVSLTQARESYQSAPVYQLILSLREGRRTAVAERVDAQRSDSEDQQSAFKGPNGLAKPLPSSSSADEDATLQSESTAVATSPQQQQRRSEHQHRQDLSSSTTSLHDDGFLVVPSAQRPPSKRTLPETAESAAANKHHEFWSHRYRKLFASIERSEQPAFLDAYLPCFDDSPDDDPTLYDSPGRFDVCQVTSRHTGARCFALHYTSPHLAQGVKRWTDVATNVIANANAAVAAAAAAGAGAGVEDAMSTHSTATSAGTVRGSGGGHGGSSRRSGRSGKSGGRSSGGSRPAALITAAAAVPSSSSSTSTSGSSSSSSHHSARRLVPAPPPPPPAVTTTTDAVPAVVIQSQYAARGGGLIRMVPAYTRGERHMLRDASARAAHGKQLGMSLATAATLAYDLTRVLLDVVSAGSTLTEDNGPAAAAAAAAWLEGHDVDIVTVTEPSGTGRGRRSACVLGVTPTPPPPPSTTQSAMAPVPTGRTIATKVLSLVLPEKDALPPSRRRGNDDDDSSSRSASDADIWALVDVLEDLGRARTVDAVHAVSRELKQLVRRL